MPYLRPLVAALLLSPLFVACGGGGGGNDPEDVLVRVVFPGPTAITDQAMIRIRGIAPDPDRVKAVAVDGLPATSGDGFATWGVDVPLVPGANDLQVDVTDEDGNELVAHVRARVLSIGQFPLYVRSLALDVASNRLYFIDAQLQTLGFVNLLTGHRTLVSGAGRGSGTDFEDPEGLVLDVPNGRAFVAEGAQGSPGSRKVQSVNLTTGNRTVVSSAAVGTGPPNFSDPENLAYDPVADSVLVADEGLSALISFDPDDGNRTEVSRTGGAGSGDDFVIGPFDLFVDFPGNTAYVADRDTVFQVTLSTGARSILSDDNMGGGDQMQTATAIVMDGGQLVVADRGRRNIIGIDVQTGDRTILSSGDVGTGPDLERVFDVANQATAGRVFACNGEHTVFDVDLSTGNRSLVFDDKAGTGEGLGNIVGDVAYDPTNGAVYALTQNAASQGVLLRVSPVTGERTELSGPGRGGGPQLNSGFGPMTLDVAGTLYVFDSNDEALYAVDLSDGDRTLVSGAGRGAGTATPSASDLLFDPVSGTVLLVASNQDHLVEIDPATGDRTTVSDNSPGQGDDFLVPDAMALDRANNRILVIDSGGTRVLYAVNRSTGVRTALTDSTQATGTFFRPSSMFLDAPNNRVVAVRDSVTSASSPTTSVVAFAIDLTTGNRTDVSALDVGVGPNPMSPRGADYDAATHRLFVADLRFDAVFVYDTRDPTAFDRAVLTR